MTNSSISTGNKLAKISSLADYLLIPEKTRSLLWITDKEAPNSGIAAFDPLSGQAIYAEGLMLQSDKDDLQAEPSLIWARLPIEPNEFKLPTEPFYYPTYRALSPQHKFQYLNWLRDITKPTWLSFVFLYLYGLERHLVLGDYENAVDEIKMLIKHHDIGTYAYNDIALASVVRGKNILLDVPDIEEHIFDPAWLRAYHKMSLTPAVVLKYAAQAGFTNTRYIKLQPDLFTEKLQSNIDKLENSMGGAFFSKFSLSGYSIHQLSNVSLRSYTDDIRTPSAQEDDRFEKIVYDLLDRTHTDVKLTLHPSTTIKKSKKTISNSAYKRARNEELDSAIKAFESRYEPSKCVEEDRTDSMPSTQFNKAIATLDKISRLVVLSPDKAIHEAHALIETGYRVPAIYSTLASAHIRKDDYQTAVDILMQARIDYGQGYDFQWELRGIFDRFRDELNTTKRQLPSTQILNESIKSLVANKEKSAWAGVDDSLDLSVSARRKLDEKTMKIWKLGKTNPEKSLRQAQKLFSDGYRTEWICKCIAAGYRIQQRYREEIDFLIQLKRDFEYYNFDSTIRQAMKLLEKSEDHKRKEKNSTGNQEVKMKIDYKILDFEDDLRYELQMMLGASKIAELCKNNGYEDMEKYFNDSAYTHTRNLYNFLKTDKMPSKADINIFRFYKDPSLKSATSSYYSEWEESLNRHVSHIAPGRLKPTNENSSGEHLNSKVKYFANDIIRLWAECTNTVSDEYIKDMLKRVLTDAQLLADNDYKRAVAFFSENRS